MFPAFIWENLNVFLYSIIAAIIAIVVIRIHARKVQETQGKAVTSFLDISRFNFYFAFIKFFNRWCKFIV